MSIPSNSYAEKVFAEHPLGLWVLDEPVHYISLINNKIKKIDVGTSAGEWTITNGQIAASVPAQISTPIENTPIRSFTSNNSSQVTLISDDAFLSSDLDTDKDTFTIALYANIFASDASNVIIGYTDGVTEETQTFSLVEYASGQWEFFSATFDLPTTVLPIQLVIKIQTETAGTNTFILNGLSVGQWSENFNSVDTGITGAVPGTFINNQLIDLPNSIALTTSKAVAASAYGLGVGDGYYLASESKLYAYNDGVPLVFGATGVTKILPRENNLPSLIIPSLGFMGALGQYQDLTFEMWIRINSSATEPKRIFGPINSTDGLYVNGPFLMLKINDNVGSFQIGEWNRPMLIQIKIANNSAGLLINGEQVITLLINRDTLGFLPKLTNDNKDQDWLGFYSYEDEVYIELDCIGIYPYAIPELLAKKRFVYGQGVEFPSKTKGNVNSYAAAIDYKFSNYANNYMYPDTNHWNRGIKNNINATKGAISTPSYTLPEILFNSNITRDDWLEICKEKNDITPGKPFINLAEGNGGYLGFNNLSFLKEERIRAFYGVFKINQLTFQEQTLIKIVDPVNGNYFEIVFDDNEVIYRVGNNDNSTNLYSEPCLVGVEFLAGIEIQKFTNAYGAELSSLFANASRLKVYVGSQPDFGNSLSGNIYKVSFLNKRNLNKVQEYFNDNGVIIADDQSLALSESTIIFIDAGLYSTVDAVVYDGGIPSTTFTEVLDGESNIDLTIDQTTVDHIATYSLVPYIYFDQLDLDIATDSYWQDYVPLKFFAKYIENQDGEQVYGLDYLQFNVDYPRLKQYIGDNYDMSNSKAKMYISFQYIASGANTTMESLNTVSLSKTNVIIPGTEWVNSKYEVNNDTIIYLPSGVNFETLGLVIHIDMTSQAIFKESVKVKYMHIAGQALNKNRNTAINTKFGVQLYPYYKAGVYPVYNAKNPVGIYKQSTPHLYLTENSGIELKELTDSTANRGIQIQVNSNKLDEYSVGSIQLAMKYQKNGFSETPKELFEILCRNQAGNVFKINIWSESNSIDNKRGRIYATYGSFNLPYEELRFYHNGRFTKDLNIFAGEWNFITFQFYPPVDFGSNGANFTGQFNIMDSVIVNNIAIYQGPELDVFTNLRRRYWSEITGNYDYWNDLITANPPLTWFDVYYQEFEEIVTVDAIEIHNDYTRSNRFVVHDDTYTVLGDYRYAMYSDVVWKRLDVSAA